MNCIPYRKFKELINISAKPFFPKGLSILLLLIILAIPSHQANWFDGLPWSTPIEFLTLVAIIPFLLLLNRDLLSLKWVGIFLFALLAVKVITVVSLPPNGLKLWIYSSEEAMRANDWERTYTTLIKPGVSENFVRDFSNNREFPIEWGSVRNLEPLELWFGIKFSGAARIPNGSQLGFIASGSEQGVIQITAVDNSLSNVPIYNNAEDVNFLPDQPQPQSGRIEGELIFETGGRSWSLIPVIVFSDGHYAHANEQNVFWQNESVFNISPIWLSTGQVLAALIDLSIFFFLWIWSAFAIRALLPAAQSPLIGGVMIAALALILRDPYFGPFLAFIEKNLGSSSALLFKNSYLTIWILAVVGASVIWNKLARAKESLGTLRAWRLILITTAPLILGYFLYQYWGVIGEVDFLGNGDWLTYQNFARQIFVDGDLWHQTEAIFKYQPLYRYIVGTLHFFFGQSTASQYFLNLWSVLITAMVISWFAEEWEVSSPYPVLGGLTIIAIQTTVPFLDVLLKALQEHPASLFVLVTAWAIISFRRDKKWQFMFLACLFGIIGLLIRIDHLFIIGAVSLFYLEPLLGSLKEVWGKFVRGFVNNWRVFAIFGLALTLALLAVASRNWIMGGKFVLTESQNKRSDIYDENFLKRFEGIAEILTASTLKTGDIAQSSFPAISILWGGTLVSFIALGWRRGPLKSFNLTLGLVCLGALLPYFFFKPTGYFPRWSIHLLPFATLAVIIFIDRFLKWNRAKASRKAS